MLVLPPQAVSAGPWPPASPAAGAPGVTASTIRAGLAGSSSPPGGQGQLEILQDLIGDLIIERAHGGQYPRHPGHQGPPEARN